MGEDLRRLRPLTQDAVEEGGLPGPVRIGEEEEEDAGWSLRDFLRIFSCRKPLADLA